MDAITELIALIEEFGTSVLRFPALAGIAVTAAVFALEIKWSRAHAPGGRRVEKAVRLGHVVEARRTTYWDDATTPAERPTSWYHALYTYDISGRQYRYTYPERAYPPPVIRLYYIDNPRRVFREERKRSAAAKVLFLLIPIAAGAGVMCLLHGCAAG